MQAEVGTLVHCKRIIDFHYTELETEQHLVHKFENVNIAVVAQEEDRQN